MGILLFEGEYKNCVRNGKGKEYNTNGKLLFEGEFKNGKKWNGIFFCEKEVSELKEGNGFIKS